MYLRLPPKSTLLYTVFAIMISMDVIAAEPLLDINASEVSTYGTEPQDILLPGVAPAGQTIAPPPPDATSNTDDRSISVPTAHWFYAGVDANFISARINEFGARVADIEVSSIVSGSPRFVVRLVKNSGAYAVPGWWWYYGLTFQQVGQYLTQNNARLIDLEPYDAGGGVIRFAAVMVSQNAPTGREWYWLVGVQPSQITAQINSGGTNHNRLIDLDTYVEGGVTKYTAVFVANTGADSKAWWWYYNITAAQVSSALSANNGRLVDLERTPSGNFNVIMVRNTGTDAAAWWWYYGLTSIGDVLKYSNQLAARPVDLETYLVNGQVRYAAIFIDNANAATRRIRSIFTKNFLDASGNPRGVFEAYLKRIGSSTLVNLNSAYPTEVASSLKALHLLHAMRQVQANADSLTSPFTYYWYPTTSPSNPSNKDACPTPVDEVAANKQTNYNLKQGLQQMMSISDNRTTRGVVLRYGFPPINATAQAANMVGTALRGNIGCAYYNPLTNQFGDPGNDTTAADLAGLYEQVYQGTILTGVARTGFLSLANPSSGVGAALQAIINQEAAALGKLAIASQFGTLVRGYSKGGSYGTCLGSPNCVQKVTIRSGAGIIRLPVKSLGVTLYRNYVYGHLISDVPVSDWNTPEETNYINTYVTAANELFREEIRSALATW